MEEVQLKLSGNGRGYFFLTEDEEQLGEMEISISQNELTIFHTEVISKAEGKGIAKRLFNKMVEYSRKNNLKVTAICPFAFAQFRRHPEEYADIINKKIRRKS
jgi:predicted GNAT family acetyltransferase